MKKATDSKDGTIIARVEHLLGMIWIETKDGSFHYRHIDVTENAEDLLKRYRGRKRIDDGFRIFSRPRKAT